MQKNSYLWKTALACFLLAGSTGVLYRLGVLGWDIDGLNLANVRHAHSHLMFFGWAVPVPLYILLTHIRSHTKAPHSAITWMKNSILASFVFGLASYPFFLFYGYKPVELGSSVLPLSVMCAGMVMICWYAFMIGYLRIRHIIKDEKSTPWFDAALVLLFVCSLGAWGVGIAENMGSDNPMLMKGLTHFFLAAFTEGWLVLALAAVLQLKLEPENSNKKILNWAMTLIAIGAPLTFPYGISESILKPIHLITARIGGTMASIGLGMFLYELFKNKKWLKSFWIWPVLFLAVKAVMQQVASILPSVLWLSDHNLRIFYLHVLLLGAYTSAMIIWLGEFISVAKKYVKLVLLTILGTLFSLLLPTIFFPESWSGFWIYYALAAFALLPILAVSILFWKLLRSESSLGNESGK